MNVNKLILSLDGKDEIKEFLAKHKVGDEVSFEGKATLDEVGPDQVSLSVTSADFIEDEAPAAEAAEPPEEEMMGGDEPAAVMMAMGAGKKS